MDKCEKNALIHITFKHVSLSLYLNIVKYLTCYFYSHMYFSCMIVHYEMVDFTLTQLTVTLETVYSPNGRIVVRSPYEKFFNQIIIFQWYFKKSVHLFLM